MNPSTQKFGGFLPALLLSVAVHGLVLAAGSRIYASWRANFLNDADIARLAVVRQTPIAIKLAAPTPPPLGGSLKGEAEALNEIDLPEAPQPRQSDTPQAAMAINSGMTTQLQPPAPAPNPLPVATATPAADPTALPIAPARPEQRSQTDLLPHSDKSQPAQLQPPESKQQLPASSITTSAVVAAEPAPATSDTPTASTTPITPDTPVTPSSTGDPLPQADSDSDPFGQARSVIIRAGKVESRFGRKIKAVRPRLRLAGQFDAAMMAGVAVTLRIKTDDTGNVISAAIIKSSGSSNIDQPVLVAMYDWWFEPPQNPAGTPLSDDFLFTITFR
ncbi:MAG: TonB family protein [Phycisphaerales bacterium]|nr:TonB family protein [Phycisphaerales bacterium]